MDVDLLWRESLQCRWTSNLEQSADGPQTARLVMQPFHTVAEDIFIRSVGAQRSVNSPLTGFRNHLTHFTYLYTYSVGSIKLWLNITAWITHTFVTFLWTADYVAKCANLAKRFSNSSTVFKTFFYTHSENSFVIPFFAMNNLDI